jgi:hypothetical protein
MDAIISRLLYADSDYAKVGTENLESHEKSPRHPKKLSHLFACLFNICFVYQFYMAANGIFSEFPSALYSHTFKSNHFISFPSPPFKKG